MIRTAMLAHGLLFAGLLAPSLALGGSQLSAIPLVLLAVSSPPQAAILFIEAESFDRRGRRVIDQQSIEVMGSPYLPAHGLGAPVDDATTTAHCPLCTVQSS